jgi:uncharacterized protein (DUF1330 family)|tara:strand:- start:647 stop:934 length:288 start_codon:yes stop_codon:yes gene_type:complete
MSGYLIAQLNVKNFESYKNYIEKVTPLVKKFGGEYIVRSGKYKVVQGKWQYERNVIIKFPSYQNAVDFYESDEYDPVKKIRENNSYGNIILIEGS